MKKYIVIAFLGVVIVIFSCTKENISNENKPANPGMAAKEASALAISYPAITAKFGNRIDPNNLLNYANQTKPAYITKDNSGTNPVNNAKATLGRVLFYDNVLSIDNTVSCASCHKQQFAFSDTNLASKGVQGAVTTRHSMRLINSRFSTETKFFWDERAATLEAQTTEPIKSHVEMGFSGQSGRPDINGLITKLSAIGYYQELFQFVYGNTTITEQRLQECMANFVRSIQSFDSKYDVGRAAAGNDNASFTNFTTQQNLGKQLFIQPAVFDASGIRTAGGFGCQNCHRAPEFDIDPNSKNNAITRRLGNAAGSPELNITRAPTLRDAVNATGGSNGQMMHSGVFATMQIAVGHYNVINVAVGNTNLDPRLKPNGFGQQLKMTSTELRALVAFIQTLSGTNVYTDVKWSNPF